ncbi:hypothetical protein THAOC_07710, partial [Thalassiosira oceanica]
DLGVLKIESSFVVEGISSLRVRGGIRGVAKLMSLAKSQGNGAESSSHGMDDSCPPNVHGAAHYRVENTAGFCSSSDSVASGAAAL